MSVPPEIARGTPPDTREDGLLPPRRIARICKDFGQRVQYSVFECLVDPAQWTNLRARLLAEIDEETDSLRFYRLGGNWRARVEHVGAKPALDLEGPLVF